LRNPQTLWETQQARRKGLRLPKVRQQSIERLSTKISRRLSLATGRSVDLLNLCDICLNTLNIPGMMSHTNKVTHQATQSSAGLQSRILSILTSQIFHTWLIQTRMLESLILLQSWLISALSMLRNFWEAQLKWGLRLICSIHTWKMLNKP